MTGPKVNFPAMYARVLQLATLPIASLLRPKDSRMSGLATEKFFRQR